jgi:hypothetical protein
VFNGHLNREPPAIDFHGDTTVPPEIKEILECALAKKPSQRFPSVKVFREELLRVAQGGLTGGPGGTSGGEDTNRTMVASRAGAVVAGPEAHGATMLDTSGTRPRAGISTGKLAAIVIVLVLAVVAAAAYFVFSGGKPEEGEPPAETAQPDSQAAPGAAPAADGGPASPAPVPAPVTQPEPAPSATPAGSTVPPIPPAVQPPASAVAPPPVVTPAAIPVTPPPPSAPADSGTRSSAMDALEQRWNEQPPAAVEPPVPEPPAPAPAAAVEPPKPKPPAPKPPERKPEAESTKPARVEQKPAEPQKPSTGGWKVIENKDRKVN